MNNMMTLWAETFRKFYPNVKIQVEGKGSSTAPPALIAGTAQFGPMSRADARRPRSTSSKRSTATSRRSSRPVYDALAVYVQQGQPDREADARAGRGDLQQDAASAATRRTSRPGASSASPATGRTGRSASTAATPPAAPTASSRSTRSRTATTRTPSRSSRAPRRSCRASTEDRFGIGYSGIGYKTSGVKVVPLAETDKGAVLRRQLRRRADAASTRSGASSTSTSTRRRASRSIRWSPSS